MTVSSLLKRRLFMYCRNMFLLFISPYYGSILWITFLKKLCCLLETRNHPYPKLGYHFLRAFLYNFLAFIQF
jgi:hypothetical protein